MIVEVLAVVLVLIIDADMAKRYKDEFIAGAFYFETSRWKPISVLVFSYDCFTVFIISG